MSLKENNKYFRCFRMHKLFLHEILEEIDCIILTVYLTMLELWFWKIILIAENSKMEATVCFPEMIAEFRKYNVKRHVSIHQENLRLYIVFQTINALKKKNPNQFPKLLSILSDVVPNDVFFSTFIKNKIFNNLAA